MGGGERLPAATAAALGLEVEKKKKKSFRVLVTGFGAFGRYTEDDNTSHLISNYLPDHLPAKSKFNDTSLPIEILNPTAGDGNAFHVSYRFVRTELPKLWAKYGNDVDLILHLGMADGIPYYLLERGGWKENTIRPGPRVLQGNPTQNWAEGRAYEWGVSRYYTGTDQWGETINDLEEDLHPWNGSEWPDKLMVKGFDLDGVVDDVNVIVDREVNHIRNTSNKKEKEDDDEYNPITYEPKNHSSITTTTSSSEAKYPHPPRATMIAHPEGGSFLCGFITYESLANKRRGNYSAISTFCHVPGWKDKASLQNGADVICSFIGVLMGRIERGEVVE